MKILLSPAKSLNDHCTAEFNQFTLPIFLKEAEVLVNKLKRMKAEKLGKLMHISSDLAELNAMRYQQWEQPDSPTETIFPAIHAFSGEVYRGFGAAALNEEEMQNAQDRIRILSGLYGILKPLDLFVPYRLEMGTSWKISEKHKNLYSFWGEKVTKSLNAELTSEEVVINLASNEYAKSVQHKKLNAPFITPSFKEFKEGKFTTVMMYAKHARGKMARYLVQHDLSTIEDLKNYTVDGYQYDDKQSDETNWVFVR
jgi:cytoplasmic iron level regulating protein YaaA (DUF328/UPF0246 family)